MTDNRNPLHTVALALVAALMALATWAPGAGAAPDDPNNALEVQPPLLAVSLELVCIDPQYALVKARAINKSSAATQAFLTVRYGDVNSAVPLHTAPGGTATAEVAMGENGRFVEAWIRNGSGETLDHLREIVRCGTTEPSAATEVVCANFAGPSIHVWLGNAGSAPASLAVNLVELGRGDGGSTPIPVTVDPGQQQLVELPVDEDRTYAVRVFEPVVSGGAFADFTHTVDCHRVPPTTPTPPPTPTPPTRPGGGDQPVVLRPAFTG